MASDTAWELRQRVENYRRALQYLDGCGDLTLEKLREAFRISEVGIEDVQLRGMWEQADCILPSDSKPGGKEALRYQMRNTLIEGIATFESVAKKLDGPEQGSGAIRSADSCEVKSCVPNQPELHNVIRTINVELKEDSDFELSSEVTDPNVAYELVVQKLLQFVQLLDPQATVEEYRAWGGEEVIRLNILKRGSRDELRALVVPYLRSLSNRSNFERFFFKKWKNAVQVYGFYGSYATQLNIWREADECIAAGGYPDWLSSAVSWGETGQNEEGELRANTRTGGKRWWLVALGTLIVIALCAGLYYWLDLGLRQKLWPKRYDAVVIFNGDTYSASGQIWVELGSDGQYKPDIWNKQKRSGNIIYLFRTDQRVVPDKMMPQQAKVGKAYIIDPSFGWKEAAVFEPSATNNALYERFGNEHVRRSN